MLISFYKKKRWKIDSSVIISPEIYKNLFSNTSGNVLKLVTVQNGQNRVIYMLKLMIACGNKWSPNLKKYRRHQKVQIEKYK